MMHFLIGIGVADFFGFSAGSAATLAAAFLAIAGTLGGQLILPMVSIKETATDTTAVLKMATGRHQLRLI